MRFVSSTDTSIKRLGSTIATVISTGSERATTRLDRLLWRVNMHDGRVNEAILLYLYVGLADVGLAGIGSDHTDCRLSTGDIWGCG